MKDHPLYKPIKIIIIILALLYIKDGVMGIFPPAYSYEVVFIADENLEEELDRKGVHGYEVVSARRATSWDNGEQMGYEFVLKKRGLVRFFRNLN